MNVDFEQMVKRIVAEADTGSSSYQICPVLFDTVCVGWDEESSMFFIADNGLVEYETENAQEFLEKAPVILEQMLQEFYGE